MGRVTKPPLQLPSCHIRMTAPRKRPPKRAKRYYVFAATLPDVETTRRLPPNWLQEYNELPAIPA